MIFLKNYHVKECENSNSTNLWIDDQKTKNLAKFLANYSKRRIQFSVLFSKTLVTECTELNSSGHASVRAENKYAWTRRIIAGAIQTPIPIPVTLYTPSNSLCISRDDACNSLAPIRLAALRIFLPPLPLSLSQELSPGIRHPFNTYLGNSFRFSVRSSRIFSSPTGLKRSNRIPESVLYHSSFR